MRLTLHIDHYNVGAVCNKLQPLGHIVGANATDHYMISPLQQGKANGSTNYINIHTKWSVYGCILHIILLNLCRNDGMLIPERGKKHVLEMVEAVEKGYEGNILFLIQMDNFLEFSPNREMDRKFSEALEYAKNKGVNIFIYNSIVREDEIILKERGILI